MGLFDEVLFKCPDCHTVLSIQSKAGSCRMETHWVGEVPMQIAADVDGQSAYCEECGTYVKVRLPFGNKVQMLVTK